MNEKKNKKGAKILLIEDDELTIRTIKLFLEQEGYSIWVAENGKKAIKMLELKPDLILLDLVLPELNGFEVLKIIRQEKGLQIPIIILSNLGRDEDIKRGLELGANDYLVKLQLSLQTIARKIKNILESSL